MAPPVWWGEANLQRVPLEAAATPQLSTCGQRPQGELAQHTNIAVYLTKPVRQAQLYDCLTTVLGTSAARPPVPLTPAPWPTKPQLQARVLVAEDNVVNQKVAVRMLEKLGCRVDVVANGLEAIVAVASVAYDCLCMDCQMPEMDGYEATTIIRQRAAHGAPHLPIIAMTANAMQSDRERCLAAGMDDYVSKPAQPNDLLTLLQK